MNWDLITNIILVSSLATMGVFACLGLYQWITRKSLKKVDKELLWMLLPLTLMVVVYIVFDHFLIWNTRPNGSGEPSFPSTHVMVVATIFFSAMLILPKYIKSKSLLLTIETLMIALILLTCVGRVLAKMHWVSDVIGGIIFALVFSGIYYIAIKKHHKPPKKGTQNAQHLH